MLKRWEASCLWLALVGLTVLTRLPALLYPRAIDDERSYGVIAWVMTAGGLPYRDALDRKPPLLFAVYWAVFRLFGVCNWLALHVVGVAWVLLTMAGLFVLTKRLAGHRAGILAALAYALVQPWATAKNLAFNGEVVMNLPLVWAYALILSRSPGSPRSLGLPMTAGVLLATAFLLKQPAAIAAVPLGLYLVSAPLWREDVGWGRATGQGGALTGGFALVLAGTTAALWHYGLLAEAVYWTVSDHTVPHIFWQHGLAHCALFLLVALPLVLPLAAWPQLKQAWRGIEPELWTVLSWLAVSVIGAAAGGRFYPHYYIQIVPPLAVLAGVAYARPATVQPRWLSLRFAAGWLAVAVLVTLCVQTAQLLAERAPSPVGRYLAGQAARTDRLFVWSQLNQQTPLYLDAGLLPASRYIDTFPLTGHIFGGPLPGVSTRNRIVPGAWANLAADFRRHPPRFIVDTQAQPGDPYPIRDFPVLARLIASDYQRTASFADGIVYQRRPDLALSPSGERVGRGAWRGASPSPNPLP